LAIVDTGLTNSVNSLSGRISAEELASSSLASRVSTEEATRSTADSTLTAAAGSLTTRISTEEAARSTADSTLTAAVSTEKSRVDAILDAADADKDSFAEIVSIINQVDTEQSTGIANIISNLNAEISATNTDVGSIDSRVSSEESVRASADASLATSISGEASSRASDVSSIDSAISAVQADVDQNEANAASDISDEQATRALAVSSLATRISTEEAARSTADSTLTAAAGSLTTRVSTEEAARATADSSLATAFASADTSLATSLATSLTTTAVTISGSSDIPFAIYNAGDTSPLFMVDSSSSWDGAPRVTIRQANDHGQEDTAYPATVNTDGAVRGVFHVEKEMSEGDYDSSTEENMPLISAFAIGDGSNAGSAATGGDAIVRLVSWGGDSKIQMYASADNYDATAIGGKRPLSGQTLGAIEMGGYATNQGPLPAAWMRVVAAETWSYSNTNGTIFQFRSTREGSGNGYSQGGIDHIVQMSHNRGFNAIAPPVAYAATASMLVLNANQTNDGWASYMFAADHSNDRMVMYVKDPSGSIQAMNLPYTIGDDVAGLSTSVSQIGSDLQTLSGSVSTNASSISANSQTIASNETIITQIRDAVNAATDGNDLLNRLKTQVSWPT